MAHLVQAPNGRTITREEPMPKLIREIVNTVEDEEGRSHIACIYADQGESGMWEGSVVFFPAEGGEPMRARKETTQPNFVDLEYWASGLTYFYLEGALHRAQRATEEGWRALRPPREDSGEGVAHAAVPLSVTTPDEGVLPRLFRSPAPSPGARRDLEGGGVLVYEGTREDGSGQATHDLSIQFGSRNAAGIAANWLYSHLGGEGVSLRVLGTPVEIRNDALREALLTGAERLS